ncbi:hypothetical protein V8F33_009587 [Rhypophila sp. PSN 637]
MRCSILIAITSSPCVFFCMLLVLSRSSRVQSRLPLLLLRDILLPSDQKHAHMFPRQTVDRHFSSRHQPKVYT